MIDDGVMDESANEQTIKRYVSLGKRCEKHTDLLTKWEACHQRDSLIDNISTIRLIFSVSDREEDIDIVLFSHFIEQRTGIRTTLAKSRLK